MALFKLRSVTDDLLDWNFLDAKHDVLKAVAFEVVGHYAMKHHVNKRLTAALMRLGVKGDCSC